MTRAKRAVDLLASTTGLVLLAPVLLLIAGAVRLDGGPAFFRQRRVGRHGREFRIWKFRTMVVDADRVGPALAGAVDPRITRVGRWLRRSKLDELPQLLNVVAGEMSLVGPRPELPRYVALYTEAQRAVLDYTPGITDPASLHYADEGRLLDAAPDPERLYVEQLLPDKIARNLAYARVATVRGDLALILRTLGIPLRAAGRPAARVVTG